MVLSVKKYFCLLLVHALLMILPVKCLLKAQGRYGSQLPINAIISLSSRKGFLYCGIDNYLQVDYSLATGCDSFILCSTNGLLLNDTLDKFISIPERSGNARLSIHCLIDKDTFTLGYRYFTVIYVPNPCLTLNDRPISSPISLSKYAFLSCDSLGIYFSDDIYGSENWMRITDFTIGYNYGEFYISHLNITNKITAQTREIINRLGPDHEISIMFRVESQGKIQKQLPIYRINLY